MSVNFFFLLFCVPELRVCIVCALKSPCVPELSCIPSLPLFHRVVIKAIFLLPDSSLSDIRFVSELTFKVIYPSLC